MFSKTRFAVVGLLLVAAAGSAQTTAVAAPATGPVVTASGRFTPLTPVRILDTRSGLGAPKGKPSEFEPVSVAVRGGNGVPNDATAALINVTVVDGDPLTSVLVYSCDDIGDAGGVVLDPQSASANLVTSAIATDGTVCFEVDSPAHLVADLAGWYGPTGTSGFNPLAPSRLLDTRSGLGAARAPLPANGVLTLAVAGQAGVPVGATAAALTITATATQGSGYVTAYPCDQPRPTASNLNYNRGATVPNLVVVPLAADGTVCLYSFAATDLIADAAGWFGAAGAGFSAIGASDGDDTLLFSNLDADQPLAANHTIAVKVRGVAGVPAEATAVALSIVSQSGPASGYLTVYPCDKPRPTASNLNYVGFDTKVATAMVPIAADGTVCVYTFADAALWVGALGYYSA